ncbi:saccharopine dehydrogenase family protein [Halovenus rubra]|uniref:Saccharopine dehydrogenase family protein n=2 Tax=Halovenus rubra TaxID=869890 RepID=A0ACC7DY21_9EURY|nr:saccharopine dehydrogenase NADP-binding domain-containing protein [Halovenus rubra]
MTTLIYGAYGYTGERIARVAAKRGLDIIVAGRHGTKTRGLGVELGVESRVFEPSNANSSLNEVETVLNCAGPFEQTADPIVDACLDTGTAYLDITGELPVFEALAERDREAEEAGIPLLPGLGFDIVPTDCLACHLHDRLPDATQLRLGVEARTDVSGGTVASAVEHAGRGACIRRDGVLERATIGSHSQEIDFGNGSRNAGLLPLADVSTAYYTTGIENIETYMALPELATHTLQLTQPLSALLAVTPVKRTVQQLARWLVGSPSERGSVFVWGEASHGEETVCSRLETPDPYALTVNATTTALQRLNAMDTLPTGFETPAVVFDADFVLGLDGVEGFHDDPVTGSV